jgi:hypothetical protein
MTKTKKPPRGEVELCPMERDARTKCLGSVRSPQGISEWRTPTLPDGQEICKFFMKDPSSCNAANACERAHVPKLLRKTCWSWEKYSLCEKGVHCWFPHPPAERVAADIALQCYVGCAERVVNRCRELLGGDAAVVATARADLSRNSNTVVFVSGGGSGRGAAHAARALAEADVHLMASVKRVYVLNSEGLERAGGGGATTGAASRSVVGDTPELQAAELTRCLKDMLSSASDAVGATLKLRVRGFPRAVEKLALDALLGLEDDAAAAAAAETKKTGAGIETGAAAGTGGSEPGSSSFELSPKDATHSLDVVGVKGRLYVGLWATGSVVAEEPLEGSAAADAAAAAATAVTACTGLQSHPALPARGAATLHALVHYGERVEEHRLRQAVMCRAYFKLEEAVSRGGVPFGSDWRCVDIGASPGGWTQFMSSRLAALTGAGGGGDGGDEIGAVSTGSGHVWAIDPGLLNFDAASFPVNVTHVATKAEDSHGAISRDAAERGLPPCDVRMLVCDANMPPAAVVGLLLGMTPMLAEGAFLVTTFKNFCKGRREWESQIDEAVVKLQEAKYTGVRVFHLFSNCAQEKTLVARYSP